MPRVWLLAIIMCCVVLTRCNDSSEQPQLKQQPQSVPQSALAPKGAKDAPVDLSLIWVDDLEMQPLATRALSGDVRPFYLVSGRIRNATGKTLASVTIRIYLESIKSNEHGDHYLFDQADVQVKGPIPGGPRGFSQQVQVLPPRGKRWTFEANVTDAKGE